MLAALHIISGWFESSQRSQSNTGKVVSLQNIVHVSIEQSSWIQFISEILHLRALMSQTISCKNRLETLKSTKATYYWRTTTILATSYVQFVTLQCSYVYKGENLQKKLFSALRNSMQCM